MNLRGILAFAALLFLVSVCPTRASAQVGVYGTVTFDHVSNIKCLQTTCGSNDGTINPLGGIGGVFYDFKTYGRVRLGADVRGASVVGNKNAAIYSSTPRPRIYSVLGGIRASVNVPRYRLTPYAEGAVGFAESSLDGTNVRRNGVQFRGYVGADFALLPVMDFRVVELGIGALQNNGSTYPVESISSGLVFHFPR